MSVKNLVKTPLTKYYGGKFSMIEFLLQFIPEHTTYVEVFGGSGALLFAKPPSPVEVFNDIDSSIVNFFRVLKNKEKFEEFYRRLILTPYSREEFYYSRDTIDEGDEIDRAVKLFILVKQSYAGNCQDWSFSVLTSARGMASSVSKYLHSIEELPKVIDRLIRVQIENYDYKKIFEIYDSENTFFYCDPPYVIEARNKTDKVYKFEFTNQNHEEFIDEVLKLKGMVLISGYEHPIYERLENNGFTKFIHQKVINTSGGSRAQNRIYARECVWANQKLLQKLKQIRLI
jgi:DNA adenine methylase